MQNTERMIINRKTNDLAELAQAALTKLQNNTYNQTTITKLADVAKEALTRLRVLTGGDYRLVIEDLERLANAHTPRGAYWQETITEMERTLQWLENAPMSRRVVTHA